MPDSIVEWAEEKIAETDAETDELLAAVRMILDEKKYDLDLRLMLITLEKNLQMQQSANRFYRKRLESNERHIEALKQLRDV
jgi:hypothetical protein